MTEDKKYRVIIEACDERDVIALKERIELYLKTLDNGDWCGRVVEMESYNVKEV